MTSLLEAAREGDLPELRSRLESACLSAHLNSPRSLSVSTQLLDEALSYAKAGDLDEATYRLRLRAEPKFETVAECEAAYRSAMVEKLAGRK